MEGGGKEKVYNTLRAFIAKNDKEFYELISLQMPPKILEQHRGNTGVTLLWPDAKYRKAIITNEKDGKEEYIPMIKALIVEGFYKTLNEFVVRKDDISNKNGDKIDIKEGSNKKVILKCGLSVVDCADFKTTLASQDENRPRFNVFCIEGDVKNQIPYGDKAEKTGWKYTHLETKKSAVGGEVSNIRIKLAYEVEQEWLNKFYITKSFEPFIKMVASFMFYLEDNVPELYKKLQPLLSWNPITSFYTLFEPYIENKALGAIDDYLSQWYDKRNLIINPYGLYNHIMSYEFDYETFGKKVADYRENVFEHMTAKEVPESIYKAYQGLVKDDPFKELGLSPEFLGTIHTNTFLGTLYLQNLLDNPSEININEAIESIKTTFRGTNYVRPITMMQFDIPKPIAQVHSIQLGFVRSNTFAYPLISLEKITSGDFGVLTHVEQLGTSELINLQKWAMDNLVRTGSSGGMKDYEIAYINKMIESLKKSN